MNAWIRTAALIPVFFVCAYSVSLGAGGAWTPTDALVGTWEGWSQVLKQKGADTGKDSVLVSITILADGTVTGKAGGAAFLSCRVDSNRGWISRKLNIRSEYIVHHGTLEGPVVPGDPETSREFTIPFSLRNGKLSGGLMIKRGLRYPAPLLSRLNLRKI